MLHFCITELRSLITKLEDYPEVSVNLQDKTKRLLSHEKCMQIRTNPKVWSNPKGKGLPLYNVTHVSVVYGLNHCRGLLLNYSL